MPHIKIIKDPSVINLGPKWAPAAKFNCKDRIVDSKGRKYQIIQKYQRAFSTCEKIKRVFLWILVVCTLGLALISKSVQDLLRKKTKTIRFALPATVQNLLVNNAPVPKLQKDLITAEELEQSRQELERGINVPEEAIENIKASFEDICNWGNNIQFEKCNQNDRVFYLKGFPNLIFKMARHQTFASDAKVMKERYQNMIQGHAAIRKYQLDQLYIPKAKLFSIEHDGKEYEIIAQQNVVGITVEGGQEKLYDDLSSELDEKIRQLTVFICKTGFGNVTWSKIPLMYDSNLHIALINLNRMQRPEDGLFGTTWEDPNTIGLVRCVSEEQGKLVEKIAKEHGINTDRFQQAHEERKKVIEDYRNLTKFYENNLIRLGNEPITIDESALDFPEESEKLKNLVKDLVKKINFRISKNSSAESIKWRRTVEIDLCSQCPDYKTEHYEFVGPKDPASYMTDEEYYDATYLGHAVKKLIEIGAIHKIIRRSGARYFLQA